MKKFLEIIKKKWLIDTTKTIILVILLIIAFLFINIFVHNLDLQPIDLTQNKLFSLSDETKEKIKDIKLNVSIYFFGVDKDSSIVNLAKQYANVNERITTEVLSPLQSPDLYEKYKVSDSSQGIVVQSPERFKILSLNDLSEYDYSTGREIDLSEQKLTNAIIDTTIAKKPKIYFLNGHNEAEDIEIFKTFLVNEVNFIENLNLLSSEFPTDCDLLCVVDPKKDFDNYETTQIINYINNGGNILWLSDGIDNSFTNINKILSLYGASIPNGVIRESNSNNIFASSPNFFSPKLAYHNITESFATTNSNSPLLALLDSSKIDIVSDEELTALNVTARPFLKTSETTYFRTDLSNTSISSIEGEETGIFNIGVEFNKTINESSSTLVLLSDVKFVQDLISLEDRNLQPILNFHNKDLVLNASAYLTERDDILSIKKSTNTITYSATETEDYIIRLIIFILPLVIVLIGFIVWAIRRYKK